MRWGRKRANWWVALVLPGLALRSLIPVGFMPMFGPDFSVRLMLCEGYAPVPSMAIPSMGMAMPADMPMDISMDMPTGPLTQHPPHGSPGQQDHSACPYGASPALAAQPAFSILPVTMPRALEPPAAAAQVTHIEIVPRAQSPRGPPVDV